MGHTADESHVVSQVGSSFLLLGAYSQLWALLRPFIVLQERQGGVLPPMPPTCPLPPPLRGEDPCSPRPLHHRSSPMHIQALAMHRLHLAQRLPPMAILCPMSTDSYYTNL